MCAQTRPWLILSSERVLLGEWSQNPCYLQGKNPFYQRFTGDSNPRRCSTQDSEPNTLPTELFRPPLTYVNVFATQDGRTDGRPANQLAGQILFITLNHMLLIWRRKSLDHRYKSLIKTTANKYTLCVCVCVWVCVCVCVCVRARARVRA